jgi:hypothetical protein
MKESTTMAKKKTTAQTPENGTGGVEMLTNKAEAIRRALQKLGNKASPTEIQNFIKTNFGIEMTNKVISVYKSKLAPKGHKRGRPRKDRQGDEVPAAPTKSAAPSTNGGISFHDLRVIKEMRDRLGVPRLRVFCLSRIWKNAPFGLA